MTRELGFSPPDRVLVAAGPAAVGLLLTAVLPIVARWALGLGIALPFRAVIRVIGAVDRPWELAVQGAILVAAGLFVTLVSHERLVTITVGPGEARFGEVSVARGDMAALYLDGETLIVLDRESRQAARCLPRARRKVLEAAFREWGFPWRDSDPYAALYRPWNPGEDGLPPAVDAVLSARAVAVRRKAAQEAGEMLTTLEKLGYSVRDDGDKQLWRPLVRS
ncbi:YqeB family protein [Actinoplanes sp. HUAS TT8]|uniref:YqeB family protein n=1 Tax=Actinoplanes sp. HUAS TT8 TaxID=3447453 RepID=UPI003F51EBC3